MLQIITEEGAPGGFTPEEIAILLAAALDEACGEVLRSGAKFSERGQQELRTAFCKSVIQQALQGQRDPHRLREGALLDYAKSKLRDTHSRAAYDNAPGAKGLIPLFRPA
jgi:hypothetical protein